MEGKKRTACRQAVGACFKQIKEETGVRDAINTVVLFCMLIFYSLTFFVPRFYGLTEKYAGLIVFVHLFVLAAVNTDPAALIKSKDSEVWAVVLIPVITLINILITDSGFGCFFVMSSFALIWYLAGHMKFAKWQFYLFGILYALMVIYWFFGVYTWMFANYDSFAMNTNTAATFTVFSMLPVLVFLDALRERYRIAQLFIVIALVKCLQISLYHRSRGAFMMLGAYLLLRYLIPKKLWEKKGFFTAVCIFATFGSLAFVALYVGVASFGVNFRMPFFYKNIFSGREAIWLEFWNLFIKKPLTGIGTNVTITSFFEFNVHNAMYNILVIHGITVFALMVYVMFRRWSSCRPQIAQKRAALTAMIAVFAVCIESFTDVDLIWANYSINMLLLLLVMNMKEDTR